MGSPTLAGQHCPVLVAVRAVSRVCLGQEMRQGGLSEEASTPPDS